MRLTPETPNLTWFEEFPGCSCGKPSRGILRGTGNENYGHHCKSCAEKRLKASEKVRKEKEDATENRS